jgi:hypothetical protein
MKYWWDRWPGRLDFEIDQLIKAGIACELDKGLFQEGIAKLNLKHNVNDKEQDLFVIFPDVYPYLKFEIFAPNLNLEHHQNPFQKNLCMIGMSTKNWKTNDTVAEYILSQLPNVLQAGNSSDASMVKNLEEPQGEPVSFYYNYFPNSIVLVDSNWSIDRSIKSGILELCVDDKSESGIHCAVKTVRDNQNNMIAQTDPELMKIYRQHIIGRWIRTDKPILENNPGQVLELLKLRDRTLVSPNPKWQPLQKKTIAVIGVIFPEEVAWRENKDGWFFIVIEKI